MYLYLVFKIIKALPFPNPKKLKSNSVWNNYLQLLPANQKIYLRNFVLDILVNHIMSDVQTFLQSYEVFDLNNFL